MKKLFIFLALAVIGYSCATKPVDAIVNVAGEIVEGKVISNGKGLANIVVTDGYNFVKTDSKGKFALTVADSAKFVSVVTPSGYTSNFTDGVPDFYITVADSIKSYNFNLAQWGEAGSYELVAIGDIQYSTQDQLNRFESEVFPDIKNYVEASLANGVKPVLITVGDITWDNFSLYNGYLDIISTLPAPLYPVIGNHDHDAHSMGDRAAAHIYNDTFGPTYYGFNLGNDYYIALDNILYDTKYKYTVALDTTQQRWVESYLKYIPAGSNIYLCMHSPLKLGKDITLTKNYEEWINIFNGYNLSVISGHTHLLYNKETLPGIFEHNVGAACGAWWTAKTGKDGVPIGYQIFESKDGEKASWRYKSVGYDINYQMELYAPKEVKEHPNAVVAHIWGEDTEWSIKGWFDDKEVSPVRDTLNNPGYLEYIKTAPKPVKPQHSDAYFVFEKPRGAKVFRVEAVDRFGNKYEESLSF